MRGDLASLPAPSEDEWVNVPDATEPITRSTETTTRKEFFGPLVKGMHVWLTGERYRRFNGVRFEFLCHARNSVSEKEWIELWGGRRGYEMITAVTVESVRFSIR